MKNLVYTGTTAANGQQNFILSALAAGGSGAEVLERAKNNAKQMIDSEDSGDNLSKQKQYDLAAGQIDTYVSATIPAIQKNNQNKVLSTSVAYTETMFTGAQQDIANGKIPDFQTYLNDARYLVSGEGLHSAAVKDMPTLNQFSPGANIAADDWDRDKRRIEAVIEGLLSGKEKYFTPSKSGGRFRLTGDDIERGAFNLVVDGLEGQKYPGMSLDQVLRNGGMNAIIIDGIKYQGGDPNKVSDDEIRFLAKEYGSDIMESFRKVLSSKGLFEKYPEYEKSFNAAKTSFVEDFIGNEAFSKMTPARQAAAIEGFTEWAANSAMTVVNGDIDSATRELQNFNAENFKAIKDAAEITGIGNSKAKAVLSYKLVTLALLVTGKGERSLLMNRPLTTPEE